MPIPMYWASWIGDGSRINMWETLNLLFDLGWWNDWVEGYALDGMEPQEETYHEAEAIATYTPQAGHLGQKILQ